MITSPMLAYQKTPDINKLRYPKIASPKLDGIRCLKLNGRALSRSFKPIPNIYVRECIEKSTLPDGVDGELVLAGGEKFNSVSSAIMSHEGRPDFKYVLFDRLTGCNTSQEFVTRLADLSGLEYIIEMPWFVEVLQQKYVFGPLELEAYEEQCLNNGYEGVIIRDPLSPYKCGRSTLREEYMLKLKRFVDSEARIIGYEEMMHNDNPAFEGELGQTKRSSCQYGQTPAGLLGALIVRDLVTGIVHKLGTGFTMEDRAKLWAMREEFTENSPWLASYKYQVHGVVVKPRSPVFKGLRHILDIS